MFFNYKGHNSEHTADITIIPDGVLVSPFDAGYEIVEGTARFDEDMKPAAALFRRAIFPTSFTCFPSYGTGIKLSGTWIMRNSRHLGIQISTAIRSMPRFILS